MSGDHDLRRILAACRGEAALRIRRAAAREGLEVVGLIDPSRDDEPAWADALDGAALASPDKRGRWPAVEAAVAAAIDAGCDAVYPGWGARVRDPDLGHLARRMGLLPIGPPPDLLATVADRPGMREMAEEVGLPVVPGSEPITELAQAQTWLAWAGLPAIVRSLDPGLPGGHPVAEMAHAEQLVTDLLPYGPVMLERQVVGAREVEVPIIGDGTGRVVCLADREITVRDGAVRVLTEAPAPALRGTGRTEVLSYADAIGRQLKWRGVASVRFLVPTDGRPYFLQVRPGVQPWHGATEALLGLDLIDAEIQLAGGFPLFWRPGDIAPEGHAIALRVRAAVSGERVGPTTLVGDLRLDPALLEGDRTAAGRALGTLVVRAPTRQACIVRARAALDRWPQAGVTPDLTMLRRLFNDRDFWRGPLDREAVAALGSPPRAGAPGAKPAGERVD